MEIAKCDTCGNEEETYDEGDLCVCGGHYTFLKTQTEPVAEVPCSDVVIKPCPFCGEQPEEGEVCAQRHMESFLVETVECRTEDCPLQGLIVTVESWQQRAL